MLKFIKRIKVLISKQRIKAVLEISRLNPERVNIGATVSFGGKIALKGGGENVFGDYTMIGYGTIIHTSTHDYNDHPMWSKRIDKPVKIGNHVWIGTNATILPGAIIEDFAVVGAGAVIAKNVPQHAIVVGNPARIIGYRNPACSENSMKIRNSEEALIVKETFNSKYYKNSIKK